MKMSANIVNQEKKLFLIYKSKKQFKIEKKYNLIKQEHFQILKILKKPNINHIK